jgi:arginase family enzyme
MPVAVATGRALERMRLDAHLDPPLSDRHVVMGGVRLTDPLEQQLLDQSLIEQLSVDDLRKMTPAVFSQLDRLSQVTDKIYVHIDMDVLDPREVWDTGTKCPMVLRASSWLVCSKRSSAVIRKRRQSGSRRFRPPTRADSRCPRSIA